MASGNNSTPKSTSVRVYTSKSVYERWRSAIPRIKNEKGKRLTKKPKRNRSPIRRDHPRCRSAIWICMCRHTRDVVIHSRFHQNPFRGFAERGGGVKICPFRLHWGYWLLQQLVPTHHSTFPILYHGPGDVTPQNCRLFWRWRSSPQLITWFLEVHPSLQSTSSAVFSFTLVTRGVVLKKEVGTPETRLRQRFTVT